MVEKDILSWSFRTKDNDLDPKASTHSVLTTLYSVRVTALQKKNETEVD